MMPKALNLKRDEKLEIVWETGKVTTFPLAYLRTMCPCAACKEVRAEKSSKKTSLTILPGNYSAPLSVVGVERIGNYALRIDWSDQHSSGIYSYQYLREIMPRDH